MKDQVNRIEFLCCAGEICNTLREEWGEYVAEGF